MKTSSEAVKGDMTWPARITGTVVDPAPKGAGLGEILSVIGTVAYAGETKVTPIIVSTRIERTVTAMRLIL
jgi:hypothetical protein